MASSNPTNQERGTNFGPMVPTQGVYLMPMQQGGKPRIIRPVPGVLCLSITTIILAIVLVILGCVAIVLKARYSYLGNPIWTGILFLLATGTLGILVHRKRTNLCLNIAFLVMTIISAVAVFQLFCYILAASTKEIWNCHPEPDFSYHYYDKCGPQWARIVVDVAIVMCALALLVLCIIAIIMTFYGTFTYCFNCCRGCCNDNPNPMVQYSPNTGILMAPINSQTMQVMAPAQVMQQGFPTTQTQPLLVAAPQPFPNPPNAPPAYMAFPEIRATPPHSLHQDTQSS